MTKFLAYPFTIGKWIVFVNRTLRIDTHDFADAGG
jgi:hypothetical protein